MLKVRVLYERLKESCEEYPDFLEWNVYLEQIDEGEKRTLRVQNKSIIDSEEWEYVEASEFFGSIPTRKVFTICVNY